MLTIHEFRTASEAVEYISMLRLKREELRKMYMEIEKDDALMDWNTKGEVLMEIVELGVACSQVIEIILNKITLHSYPFTVHSKK